EWDKDSEEIWRDPDLARFVHEIYEQEPEMPFVLTSASVVPVLELIFAHEEGIPPKRVHRPPLPPLEKIHERFVPEARRFFESVIEDKAQADRIADACVERLESAIAAVF